MFIIKVTLDLTIKYTRHVHYKSDLRFNNKVYKTCSL